MCRGYEDSDGSKSGQLLRNGVPGNDQPAPKRHPSVHGRFPTTRLRGRLTRKRSFFTNESGTMRGVPQMRKLCCLFAFAMVSDSLVSHGGSLRPSCGGPPSKREPEAGTRRSQSSKPRWPFAQTGRGRAFPQRAEKQQARAELAAMRRGAPVNGVVIEQHESSPPETLQTMLDHGFRARAEGVCRDA